MTRPASGGGHWAPPLAQLTPQERAVYDVLAANAGRVLSRSEIAQAAGIADLSERRCDALIVGIRRRLGQDSVITVRRRGWRLNVDALEWAS